MDAIARKTIAALRHPPRSDGCTRKTLQCDFWNWGPDQVRPDCCTEHLREVLFFTADLLARHGIRYWLDYGTLLGAARSESFIPWDDDVDLGVLAADRDRLLALEPQIVAAGYHFKPAGASGVVRVQYSRVNCAAVDLFLWSREGDQLVAVFDDESDWPGTSGATSFPASYLEPGGDVRLYGRVFPTPAPLDSFLRRRYGPNYMTPSRGVGAWSAWCPPVTPDELTPAAETLLKRISQRGVVLHDLLCRSRLSRLYSWRVIWLNSAVPRGPAAWALAQTEAETAPADRTPTVQKLIHSLATLETAIAELEHPPRSLPLRRASRRVAWVGGKALERLSQT